ncbi:hypothetical protein AK812_SmicGene6629 [Symbiodinium microadriaticum]|uniref:Uncharacterized protein n=1 Tax=Symbiodinium microadriaticum TaxID=2951 RepID=A0A1Q9EQQ5_SYMMI|nr:hypothetical protein AK812_SmicGene6629 [Symbiodinium microadriaticum]
MNKGSHMAHGQDLSLGSAAQVAQAALQRVETLPGMAAIAPDDVTFARNGTLKTATKENTKDYSSLRFAIRYATVLTAATAERQKEAVSMFNKIFNCQGPSIDVVARPEGLFWEALVLADFCVPPAELEPWVIVLVFGLLVGGSSTGCPSQRIGLTRTDRTDGHRWLAAFYVSSLLVTEVSMPSLRDGPWVMLPLLIIVLTLMQRWTHVFELPDTALNQWAEA